MFNNLKSVLITEAEVEKENSRFFISNGYLESWNPESHKFSDEGICRYSTARRLEQYRTGEISREKAVQYATTRREKEINKRLNERLAKLDRVASSPDLTDVSISVEWRKSSVWGYNPFATVTIHTADGWKQYTGTASGCGYDKLTAAVGSALNQSLSVLKMLYTTKEDGLNNPPEFGRFNGVTFDDPRTNASLIHYGAGYGALPYFEGGVGISSFFGVFEKCGFRCISQNETRTTNYYHFSRVD